MKARLTYVTVELLLMHSVRALLTPACAVRLTVVLSLNGFEWTGSVRGQTFILSIHMGASY